MQQYMRDYSVNAEEGSFGQNWVRMFTAACSKQAAAEDERTAEEKREDNKKKKKYRDTPTTHAIL